MPMTTRLTLEGILGPPVRGPRPGPRRGTQPAPRAAPGRVPRIARLLALAHRFERLLESGAVRTSAELARLGHVSPARISQIMNLLLLAPDIQEQILFASAPPRGRDPIRLGQLQAVAAELDWQSQRRHWATLLQRCGGPPETPTTPNSESLGSPTPDRVRLA
jgi:hypothetical protein